MLPSHTCCIKPTRSCIRNSCEGEQDVSFFPSLFGVKTDKVRSEHRPPHQLKESPHQEPLAYPRRTREVELVAEGRSEDEVEHVW